MIGSIFYHGQQIVLDEDTGKVNREGAERLIALQEEFSDKTGTPCMLDVVGASEEAMKRLIDLVADTTETPILIDSPSAEVRIAGTRYAKEVGLEGRVVYNSLVPGSKPEEFQALKESCVESSVVLTFRTALMTSEGRAKLVEELLPRTEQAGISKLLIDTCVIDVPSLSVACRAMLDLKRRLGIPCGCGAHNAISTWAGFRERMGPEAVKPCTAGVNVAPVVLGADFVLYGPIEDCRYVFPAVAAINASYRYLYKMREQLEL